MRSSAAVRLEPPQLAAILADVAASPRYDTGVMDAKGFSIADEPPEATVGHIRLRPTSSLPMFNQPYDFVFLQLVAPHPDDAEGFVVVRRSVEISTLPEASGFATRGRMLTSGFVVLPHPEEAGAAEVTCVQSLQLGGWTPTMITRGLAQQQCLVVGSLQESDLVVWHARILRSNPFLLALGFRIWREGSGRRGQAVGGR